MKFFHKCTLNSFINLSIQSLNYYNKITISINGNKYHCFSFFYSSFINSDTEVKEDIEAKVVERKCISLKKAWFTANLAVILSLTLGVSILLRRSFVA
jgi:hypothetical protein